MKWISLFIIACSVWFTVTLKAQVESIAVAPERPVAAKTLAASSDPFESVFLDQLNTIRAGANQAPVSYNNALHTITEARRDDMIELGYYAHKNPLSGLDFSAQLPENSGYACENLLLSKSTDPAQVLAEWQASASHNKCLLHGSPTHAAVSVKEYTETDAGTLYLYVYIASAL